MLLDAHDWTILRALLSWEGNYPSGPLRTSLGDLAKRTGLHKNTVRLRLLALQRGGVFEGTFFEPHPEPLRLVRGGFFYEGVEASSSQSFERALEGAPRISQAVLAREGALIHLWAQSRDELEEESEHVAASQGWARPKKEYLSTEFPRKPASPVALSPVDARLLLALRSRPARSVAAIARSLGITERTAERRARGLIDKEIGYMFPRLRPGRIEGALLVGYGVLEGDKRARQSLATSFPDRIIGPMGPGMRPVVAVPMPNLEEAERRRAAAERMPGIRVLRSLLYRDVVYPAGFDAWIAARVGSLQPAAPKT